MDARDLSAAQKEQILGQSAVAFFGLKNLPEPRALKIARQSWEQGGQAKAAVG